MKKTHCSVWIVRSLTWDASFLFYSTKTLLLEIHVLHKVNRKKERGQKEAFFSAFHIQFKRRPSGPKVGRSCIQKMQVKYSLFTQKEFSMKKLPCSTWNKSESWRTKQGWNKQVTKMIKLIQTRRLLLTMQSEWPSHQKWGNHL